MGNILWLFFDSVRQVCCKWSYGNRQNNSSNNNMTSQQLFQFDRIKGEEITPNNNHESSINRSCQDNQSSHRIQSNSSSSSSDNQINNKNHLEIHLQNNLQIEQIDAQQVRQIQDQIMVEEKTLIIVEQIPKNNIEDNQQINQYIKLQFKLKAIHCLYEKKNYQQCQQLLKGIQIELLEQQYQDIDQILSYVYSRLAMLIVKNNKNQYQNYLSKALNIYEKSPTHFIQDHISLLDNIAHSLLFRNKNNHKSIQLYTKALQLSESYYLIHDHRKFYLINNLMCAYFQNHDNDMAQKYYKKVNIEFDSLKSIKQLLQVRQLLEKNYQNYKPRQITQQRV